jgi:hypothetical protein
VHQCTRFFIRPKIAHGQAVKQMGLNFLFWSLQYFPFGVGFHHFPISQVFYTNVDLSSLASFLEWQCIVSLPVTCNGSPNVLSTYSTSKSPFEGFPRHLHSHFLMTFCSVLISNNFSLLQSLLLATQYNMCLTVFLSITKYFNFKQ